MNKILLSIISFFTITTAFAHEESNYILSDFFKGMQAGDKAAILMVHFGTTHDDTRELTIEALNNQVKQSFPNAGFREAYSSRIVIKRLAERGINKMNPLESLQQLHTEGYTHVLIQASTVIDGVEMESLYKNADEVSALFKDLRIGTPLLYFPSDYEEVISVLTANNRKDVAYVWVGHGTYDATTAQYAMMDYMLKAKGHTNCFVGTIEGYPGFADVLAQLKTSGLKEVVLVPFMFVAGEHAKNDIAEDWAEGLEKEGFSVKVDLHGLGENPGIREIYLSHLKFITSHRKVGIMEKKSIYEKTGEKLKENF
jgi:sirohydrochlorin cobaltochelatase